jgi:hypothetical protein
MHKLKWMGLLIALGGLIGAGSILGCHPYVQAGVGYGPEPACPYGYYEFPPYDCAPYGYYGPEWFVGGAFIGAGPWYHGHRNFQGRVDQHYDPRHGYHGSHPTRGEQKTEHHEEFHGQTMHDPHGNEAPRKH